MIDLFLVVGLAAAQGSVVAPPASAQTCQPAISSPVPEDPAAQASQAPASAAGGTRATFLTAPEPSYTVGIDDVLTVRFWRDEAMSGDAVVRSDGKISLPLINEVDAVGLTPLELCGRITEAAAQFIQSPTVSVIVKQINSRKVYVTGMVARGGAFPISGPMTVMQLIALAGGLQDYADAKNVLIVRTEAGTTTSFKVNYEDLSKGKNLGQNIQLKPGDTMVVR